MRYKNSIKIIIDKRKLDTLLRLNCPIEILVDLVFRNKLNVVGDSLIDDNLESLLEIKEFNNWGGSRAGSGRPHKNQDENQLENQDDNQDENQDINQVGDKDKDKDIDIDNTSNITNSISNKEYKKNKKIKKDKNIYGEFKNVKLTNEEYEKLNNIYQDKLQQAIEKLSCYIESSGRKYNNHYAVLGKHNWVYKEIMKNVNNDKNENLKKIMEEVLNG